MRRISTSLLLIICSLFFSVSAWAQSDDIEVTDSTSTEWGGGEGGGGLNPLQPDEPVTSLTLSKSSLTIEGGERVRLVATVNQRAKDKRIAWTSANSEIASVDDDGIVMGLAMGTSTVTATAMGNTSLKQTCRVTVTSDYVPPASGYILPWGKDEAWTMKYVFQEQSSFTEPANDAAGRNWKQPDYDDSQWPTLTGPIGSDGIWYSVYNYVWRGEYNCFCLRREFELINVNSESVYTFYTQHDDDIQVFVNGVEVFNETGWTDERIVSCTIPHNVLKKGKNMLAIFIKQNWGGAFLDYALYQKTPRKATPARLPNVPFEFYYNAIDYDEETHDIPNQANANLAGASLTLTENLPQKMSDMLRITERSEGYIDRWGKGSTESGAYFYRGGQDCITIVAKVAPKLDSNSCDFIANRGGGYNYMWRIGDRNRSYLHTGTAYQEGRSLLLTSEQPQVLSVRVDGINDYILLQNLTTNESKRINAVDWGGGNNVFKLFYNDGGEYWLGDFYWVYYSFELLTDAQLAIVAAEQQGGAKKGDANGDGKVDVADIATIISIMAGTVPSTVNADANGDGKVDVADIATVISIMAGGE